MRPKNTAGKISALLCLLAGGGLFIMSYANVIAFPAIAQTLGLILLVAAVYIASAYLLRQYTVSVELAKDERCGGDLKYEFRIDEHKSRMSFTVCRFWINEISLVRVVDARNKKQINAERKKKSRYTYDSTFAPAKRIEISACVDGEDISIFVTYDEDLFKALNVN
jgi:hypothetical protein